MSVRHLRQLLAAILFFVLLAALRLQDLRMARLTHGTSRVAVENTIGLPLRHFDLDNGRTVQLYTPSFLVNTLLHTRGKVDEVTLFPRFYMARALVFERDGRLLHNSVVGESDEAMERELEAMTHKAKAP